MNSNASGKVVILDRDGTIVVDRGYLADPAGLEFLPGAAEGLRLMHQRGCRLVVITNQSGVGRGLFSLGRLHEMNSRLEDMVRLRDARIERIYYCPHRPDENCRCRKPQTKLLMDAARDLSFEPAKAVVIGDKSADIEFGRRAGAVTMLVSSDGLSSDGKRTAADYVVRDLLDAAAMIDRLESAAVPAPR